MRSIPSLTLAALLSCVACSDGTGPGDTGRPHAVTAAIARAQSGEVALAVATPSVTVTDRNGRPVPGVAVHFELLPGGGALALSDAVTDADGFADAGAWILGSYVGEYRVVATVEELPPVDFVAIARAGPVFVLTDANGVALRASPGAIVQPTPTVRATDRFGNLVPGVNVEFTALEGAITGGTAVTNSEGIARIGTWRLDGSTENRLIATVGTVTRLFRGTPINP
jgi:hypothetical protein